MTGFLERLRQGPLILMDGAMGTELIRLGANPRENLATWNLTHPEEVRSVHQAYVSAGADVLLTNTFQANPLTFAQHGSALCQAGIALARSAAPKWVLGSIGPISQSADEPAFADEKIFRESLDWLSDVDGWLLETISDASIFAACGWARTHNSNMPLLVSLCYRRTRTGLSTWAGESPERIARLAEEAGADALGVNCGLDIGFDEIAEILARYQQVTPLPLFARPNAGTPACHEGTYVYPATPESFAADLPRLLAAKVRMLGGCCGTTPSHIAAWKNGLGDSRSSNPLRVK